MSLHVSSGLHSLALASSSKFRTQFPKSNNSVVVKSISIFPHQRVWSNRLRLAFTAQRHTSTLEVVIIRDPLIALTLERGLHHITFLAVLYSRSFCLTLSLRSKPCSSCVRWSIWIFFNCTGCSMIEFLLIVKSVTLVCVYWAEKVSKSVLRLGSLTFKKIQFPTVQVNSEGKSPSTHSFDSTWKLSNIYLSICLSIYTEWENIYFSEIFKIFELAFHACHLSIYFDGFTKHYSWHFVLPSRIISKWEKWMQNAEQETCPVEGINEVGVDMYLCWSKISMENRVPHQEVRFANHGHNWHTTMET